MIWTILPKLMGRRRNTASGASNRQDAPARPECGIFVGDPEVAKGMPSGAFQVVPFEAIEQGRVGTHIALTTIARRAADASCDRLLEIAPSLFEAILPGCDLAGSYRAWLTYWFLQTEVTRLAALSERRELVEAGEDLLVQTALPARVVEDLLRSAGRPHDAPKVHTTSGLPAPDVTTLLAAAARWRVEGSGGPTQRRGRSGVAFVAGTSVEADWMYDVASRLRPNASTIVMKKKREDLLAAVQRNSATRPLPTSSWRGLGHRCLNRRDHDRVTAALTLLFEALAREENEALRPHGEWVLNFFGNAVSAIGLDRYIGPRVVVGSLERSPIGLVLSALGPALGIRTVTIQHGNIALQGMLDLVRFDRFGIWDEGTRRTLLADGYPADAEVRPVGRPPFPVAEDLDPAEAAGLREWIGGRRAVVLFLQPPKPPHVSMAALAALLDHALEIIGSGEHYVLLVKPHPANTADEIRVWRDRIGSDAAVRFLAPGRETMDLALTLCEVALSLSSTALSDAAAAGRMAIAFETRSGIGAMQLGLPPDVHVARNAGDLRALLSKHRQVEGAEHAQFVPAVADVITELL